MTTVYPKITRDELAKFLPSDRAIRAFEGLFGLTGDSDATIQAILAILDLVQTAPIPQQHNSVATDYIDLPYNGPHVTRARRIQWNEPDGTIDVGLLNGVTLQVGQEMHYYAKNTSGVTIPDGGSVMATGVVGNSGYLTIAKAVADGSVAAKYMLGISTQSIADGEFGYVTSYGVVRGINTSAYTDGDLLYFNPATPGTLTKTEPAAPKFKSAIAIVTHAHSNGSILVRMKNGEYLHDILDVEAPSLSNNEILHWVAANSRWENASKVKGLSFGVGSDYSTFEDDGTLVAYGAATVWQDIDFPIIVRTTGVGIPTLTTMEGNITAPQWAVNDFNVCEGQEMIHAWKEGSTATFHIHMVTAALDASDRYTKWEVEWCWADFGTALSAAATITSAELLIPANTAAKTHLIFNIGTITLTGGHVGAHVWARLKRIAAVGTVPSANPWCSMLQLHVECDTIGSRTITAK